MKNIEETCKKLVAEAKGIVEKVAAGGVLIPKTKRKPQIKAIEDVRVIALRFLNTPGVE